MVFSNETSFELSEADCELRLHYVADTFVGITK